MTLLFWNAQCDAALHYLVHFEMIGPFITNITMQTNHRFPYPAENPLMNENPDPGEGEWSIGDPLSEFSKLGTHLLPCSSDLPSPLCHSLLLGVISAESSRTEAPVGWGLWAFVVMLTRVIFLPCLSSGFAAREHVRSGFRQGSARSESSVLPDTSIKRVAAEVRGSSLLPRDGANERLICHPPSSGWQEVADRDGGLMWHTLPLWPGLSSGLWPLC